MLLSLFFGVMSHVLRGWRWKQTLEPLDAHPKTSDCVDAIFVSYATNLVLPLCGEVSRCGYLPNMIMFPAKSLGDGGDGAVGRYALHSADYGITFWRRCPSFSVFSRRRDQDSFAGASCDFSPGFMSVFLYYWCFWYSLFSVAYAFFFEKVKGVV